MPERRSTSPRSTMPTAGPARSRSDAVLFLATVALVGTVVAIVYGRAVRAPFIFDDLPSVTDNQSITRIWPLFGDFSRRGPLTPPPHSPTGGRPLVNLSFAINYYFGRYNPVGYHIFNLVLHVLSAGLLAVIVRRTMCSDYFQGKLAAASWPLSLLVALVWALHPLQSESVIYVTQRTELLVGFFCLGTLYSAIRYWTASGAAPRAIWWTVATAACLCGMASKEVMVSTPLVVLLFERTFVGGSFRVALRKSWPLYLGLAAGWALLFILNWSGPRSDSAGFDLDLAPHVWWLIQAKVLLMYLKLAVWPWPLVIHYGTPLLLDPSTDWPWALPAVALAIGTLVLLWRNTAAGFLCATVWLLLAPTLIVPIITEVAAERRMYLPLAALVPLVVVGGYRLILLLAQRRDPVGGESLRRLLAAGGCVIVVVAVAYSLVDFYRTADYETEQSIWRNAYAHQPDDPIVLNNLGQVIGRAGQIDDARNLLQRAVELSPKYVAAHVNLGIALFKSGRKQQALDQLETAARLNRNDPAAQNNLGATLFMLGRVPEAIEHYRLAIRLKPYYAPAYDNLGEALLAVNQVPEAMQQLETAVRINPDYAEAYMKLGEAYGRSGRPADALAAIEKALSLARDQMNTQLIQDIEAWQKKRG